MKKLKFIVSVTNDDNDYQLEQAAAAEEAGKRLGLDVQIIHADNDAITQSQQLLKIIQSRSDAHPDGIVFEPVGGTALPQVARAAAEAGIGWAVLNRDAEYISELRKSYRIPAFADVPYTEVYFADTYDEIGPLGAKSQGECAINPVAPAIANALANATSVRFAHLPFTADRIFAKLPRGA